MKVPGGGEVDPFALQLESLKRITDRREELERLAGAGVRREVIAVAAVIADAADREELELQCHLVGWTLREAITREIILDPDGGSGYSPSLDRELARTGGEVPADWTPPPSPEVVGLWGVWRAGADLAAGPCLGFEEQRLVLKAVIAGCGNWDRERHSAG
ncbi:MAG TPA: hypothetical protein VNW71_02920 [Thermoanaerobaculia bacterium]|nr:hypothetical protein [Thermoanaerobaculia bacterium]